MKILTVPNIILKTPCSPVEDFSRLSEIYTQICDFLNNETTLVGIAANQLGFSERFFLINSTENAFKWDIYVNPKIKPDNSKGEEWGWEGCASIPTLNCLVKRWKVITLTAQNLQGEIFSKVLKGYSAGIAQHEMEHLNGKLMTEKARERKTIQ